MLYTILKHLRDQQKKIDAIRRTLSLLPEAGEVGDEERMLDELARADEYLGNAISSLDAAVDAVLPGGIQAWREFFAPAEKETP